MDVYKRAKQAKGGHMDGPRFRSILGDNDWAGLWPEVDTDGRLTGAVLDSDQAIILVDWVDGHLSNRGGHACDACIRRCNAPDELAATVSEDA